MKKRSAVWQYVRDYKFHSILVKNMAALSALVLIPVTAALYLGYSSYARLYESEVLRQNETTLSEFMTLGDQIFLDTGKRLASMSLAQEVELFLYADSPSQINRTEVLDIQQLEKMQVLETDFIKTVYLYGQRNGYVITDSQITALDRFRDRGCMEAYMEHGGELEYPKIMTSLDFNDVRPAMRISVFYDVYFGDGQKGFAVANLDPKALREELEAGKDGAFSIVSRDTVVYASATELVGEPSSVLLGRYASLEEGIYFSAAHPYAVKRSQDTGLLYLYEFPAFSYPRELTEYGAQLGITVAVLIVLCLLLCCFLSVKMFRPIEAILRKVQRVPALYREEPSRREEMNELYYIMKTIEKTETDRTKTEEELKKRVEMLKKAQAIALQAQINPHFIHNTLQTVDSLAMLRLGPANDVSAVTAALSGMLRLSLENTDNIVSIRQEREHCMLYLEIQKRRYPDRFDVIWDIPDELLFCRTVKIVMQPIVENCIYHGIKPMSGKGKICVKGRTEGETVCLVISDNGLGMDPEKLAELQKQLSSEYIRESRHLGVANVNQRIRLYFGEEYGVQIESSEDTGTTVTLRFPRICQE